MRSRAVAFASPRTIAILEEDLEPPGEGELAVETRVSAISAGTELLFYRGELAEDTPLDESLSALGGTFHYPVVYGYAAVGDVVAVGPGLTSDWLGRCVFAFAPHRSHFVVKADDTFRLPDGADPERAALLPTAETAVNLLLDAAPLVGERVLVAGQGVVGLMTTAFLARFPLARLSTVDRIERRRTLSRALGAMESSTPAELSADSRNDFDLAFELTGAPSSLNEILPHLALEGRIVVGSWYGEKRAAVVLGTHFHRRRLKLVSSQVSRIGGPHTPRWSKARRLATAWTALSELPVESIVSHRFPFSEAASAYRQLDEAQHESLQVLLTYT